MQSSSTEVYGHVLMLFGVWNARKMVSNDYHCRHTHLTFIEMIDSQKNAINVIIYMQYRNEVYGDLGPRLSRPGDFGRPTLGL